MGTNLRTDLRKSNKYYISKQRRLELTHFCLQYPEWLKCYNEIGGGIIPRERLKDPTWDNAERLLFFRDRMEMVERAAYEADDALGLFLFRAVTEGVSFAHLKMKYGIPCERDMYYDRFHRFFWILNKLRE